MSGPSAPSAPTSSTTNTSNIPDYAAPYVTNMLNATQAQIYGTDANGNLNNTFKPYQAYSNNPQDYVAGFSPLQQQAQSSAANMQVPGQYGAATGMTMGAGAQSMGLAGQEAQTGSNLAQASTNPYAVGAYMNPYIQNALAPAQQLLNQQYGMQGAAQQGQATSSGAFGGSRNALQQGLNQQNQMLAQNQLVGNAYQQAYGNAQNQMNTVSSQGLAGQQAAMQGLGQGLTSANQLAGIGGQELAAQQGIIGTQATQGAAQQAQQQQMINQQIQNYATAQQYPYMQLGMLNAELRGLPMQQTSTAQYQAQPSAGIQAAGLLGAAGSLYGGTTTGKAAGGSIKTKKMASGGITDVPGFKYGTLINDAQLQNDATQLSSGQLQGRIADPAVNQDERAMFQGMQADQNRLRQNPSAGPAIAQAGLPPQQPQGMAPPPQNPQQMPMDARMAGIAQGGGGAFQGMASPTRRMAGGGILAFAGDGEEGSQVKETPQAAPIDPESSLGKRQAQLASLGIAPGLSDEEKAQLATAKARTAEKATRADMLHRENAANAFLQMARTAGPIGSNIAGAGQTYLQGEAANRKSMETYEDTQQALAAGIKAAERKRAEGDVDGAQKLDVENAKLKNAIDVEAMRVKGQIAAASIPYADKKASKEAIRAELKAALGRDPTESEILSKYTEATTTAGETADTRARIAANSEYQKWEKGLFLAPEYADLIAAANKGDKEALAKLAQVKQDKYTEILGRVSASKPAAPTAPVAQPSTYDKGSVVKYDGKEYKFKGGDQYDRKNWEAV